MADMNLTLAIRATMPREILNIFNQMERVQKRIKTQTAAGTSATNQQARAAHGAAAGFAAVGASAKAAGQSVQEVGRFGKFAFDVMTAFALYKGFVFLKTQVEEFIRSLVDLEHEIAIVQTQLNHLGQDFRPAISTKVIKTAQETGLAFSSVAKAEFEVVSANIAVADSFEIVDLAARAAVAGGMKDAELAFNAALSQVNAFGLANDQFGEVFDKQFNLIKRGIFTYEQFATVVGSVSEAFGSTGQDIETANASLAAISQVFTGKQLERGATGLRNAVLRIGEAREEFKEMGVEVVDAQGNFRNFILIGEDLNRALDGLTEAERSEAIRKLFPDERERRGMNAFLGQLDQAKQFYVEQKRAAGDLDEAFETVEGSLKVQADILKNDLAPALLPVVEGFGQIVGFVNDANDELPGFTQNIGGLAVAMAALAASMLAVNAAQAQGFFGPTGGKVARGAIGAGIGLFGIGNAFASQQQHGLSQSERNMGLAAGVAETAVAGAVVGSVVPGVGTALGASVGALAGLTAAYIGSMQQAGVSFDETGETVEQFEEIFREMVGEVFDAQQMLIEGSTGAAGSLESYAESLDRASLSTFADTLAKMGPSGEKASSALDEASRALQAFTMMTAMSSLTIRRKELKPQLDTSQMMAAGMSEEAIRAAFIDRGENPFMEREVSLFEAMGLDPVKIGEMFNAQLLASMGAIGGNLNEAAFVDAFLSLGESVEEATDTIDPFAEAIESVTQSIKALDLQAKQIEMGAKLQQRELTAEEFDRLRRIDAAKLDLEVGGHNLGVLKTFNDALGTTTGSVRQLAEAATDSAAMQNEYTRSIESMMVGGSGMGGMSALEIQQGLSSSLQHGGPSRWGLLGDGRGLDALRFHDRVAGGFKAPAGAQPGDFFGAFFKAMESQATDGARRGGLTINFLGPTTPSAIDQAAQRLAQEGWLQARQRRRARGSTF